MVFMNFGYKSHQCTKSGQSRLFWPLASLKTVCCNKVTPSKVSIIGGQTMVQHKRQALKERPINI